MDQIKQLVKASVRSEIRARMLAGTQKSLHEHVLYIESPILLESLKKDAAAIFKSGLEKYRLMFLENGNARYFFVDGDGKFDAIEFNGTAKGERISFSSKDEMNAFIEGKKAEGFTAVTRDGGIVRFLKAIGRSFGSLLMIIGIIGIAIAVLYLLYWLYPVAFGTAAFDAYGAAVAGATAVSSAAAAAASTASGAASVAAGAAISGVASASAALTGVAAGAISYVSGITAAVTASTPVAAVSGALGGAVAFVKSVATSVGAAAAAPTKLGMVIGGGMAAGQVATASAMNTGIVAGAVGGSAALVAAGGGWMRAKLKKNS